MKVLQLFKDGKEQLGSDGIMYVDGRLSHSNIVAKVKERNKRYSLNFPHMLTDSFAIYTTGRVGGCLSKKTYIE